MTSYQSGMTLARLRRSVERDSYSDFLPLAAWVEEEQAFLTIDDGWGYSWELIPSPYMFAHVHEALLGLLNVNFPEGTILQLQSFADPLIDDALDAFLDLKTRPDPLIQASARRTFDYLRAGTMGLKALHGIPIRDFRAFLSVKTRAPMDSDLRRQIEEQLAKLGIRPMAPSEIISLYRRIFNGVHAPAPGVFTQTADVPLRRQIIDAGPALRFDGPEVYLGNQVARCLTPKSPPRRITAERANRLTGGMRGSSEDSDQIGGPFLYTLNVLFDHSAFEIHKRAQILSAQKAAGSFAVEVGKQIEEIGWILDEAGNTRFVSVIPTMWVFGRDRHQAREMAARAKRLWESEPLPWMVQEESYLNPILLAASLPFGLYPERRTIGMLQRDFRVPVRAGVLMSPIQTDFRGGGRPALLYTGRKGQLITLDLFDPRINNYNFIVSAESGAGKSFLLNNLCQQYFAQNALIRIIDIGGSYKKLCTLCSGRYIDLGEEHLVLNPFDLGLALDGDDRESAISMAVSIVAEMANAGTRKGVTTSEWNLLKSAVQWAIESGRAEAGIDAVREWLGSYPANTVSDLDRVDHLVPTARELAFNLRDFGSDGAYGHYFNGPSTFDISNDEFVVLELERLKAMPDLFNVVVMVVINAVTQELYLSARDRPRFVLCDEAAQFMTREEGQDLSRLAEAISQGYRRARKYRGSFGIILQSMNDLLLFGGTGQVILENAATRFLLQGSTYDKAVENKILDYSGFVLDLLKSVRNNKPNYSEVFIDSPLGLGIARLVVDPFSYWINTSAPEDVAAFEALVRAGRSPLEAVCDLAGVDPAGIIGTSFDDAAPLKRSALS
ncbi:MULTISPECIES: TraC family protein [Sphingomonadales]|jgi:conjugal transfer ATP-binding protein TraC|uniref:Conjugal transfer ATP-binding protein TraC n=4 Tax=Sphingomonadales TaxID=204457 RepID=A0A7W6FRY1_9SPHN|nr:MULTISPECIES: TraC family protein [Sphingomonadales]EZP71305.1 Type-IV secretion system protein TraC [Sphingomonas paucimobilis]AMK24811.1 type IV secretory pathway VirB4 component [Sphingobium sp. TKS]AZI37578.1 conjugal transfer protein [Caenibius tardaugens NBRC 16725]EQA98118.1 sex pilus assembly protein [Sphingobium baderi LL03]KMS63248.1 sex pilus assembly protein [Sphingobium baderi LL03]